MEQDVDALERGVTLEKLNQIETRLTGVETSLQDLIDNQEEMKSELKDSLETVKIEMEKNTNQVRRLQTKYRNAQMNSRYLFCVMFSALILWTIVMNYLNLK
tara:strand:- start:1932 stop:2237 length:306 start_codon:yes stop_codon:yes gene_type:complete